MLFRSSTSLALGMFVLGLSSAAHAAHGAGLLPPHAQPHGYSLSDMAEEVALFTTSGNDPEYYPETPFEVLHIHPEDRTFGFPSDGGMTVTGESHFTVRAGALFYVPIFNIDDSPPVLGDFPADEAGAHDYFFGADQMGGSFELIVDGEIVGPDALEPYLAGPVVTEPLLNGGGTHIITLGVFLAPMSAGEHTVQIRGVASGLGLQETFGLSYVSEDLVYLVDIVPEH